MDEIAVKDVRIHQLESGDVEVILGNICDPTSSDPETQQIIFNIIERLGTGKARLTLVCDPVENKQP